MQSFAERLITNASLLVNLPSFAEACELARRHGLQDRLGLHVNVTEGAPLTDADAPRAGILRGRAVPAAASPAPLPAALGPRAPGSGGGSAGADRRRPRAGITLSYLDSHNDVHTIPSIGSILVPIARAAGITRIRLSRNCGPRQGIL